MNATAATPRLARAFRLLLAAALTALLPSPPDLGGLSAQQTVDLPGRDRALTLPMRTLFQVGELEGEDYETFAGVTDLAFDQAGNLYLLDGTAYRVLVFDAEGRYLRTIGRQGDGPGEFGFPSALAVLPGAELVVNDAAKANLQVFGPDGTFRRTVVLDQEFGRASGRMRLSPDGSLVTETMQLQRLAQPADRPAGPQRVQLPPRSVTSLTIGETAQGRRLFNAAPRSLQMAAPRNLGGGNVRISMSVSAFEPSLLWAPVAGGGLAALNGADYRIAITSAQGRTSRVIRRPIEPRKVTQADRKRFLENRRNGSAAGGSGGVAMVAVGTWTAQGGDAPARAPSASTIRASAADIDESDVNWNDVIPVINALDTDSFGRLWVQRSAPDLGDGPIDLIDPAGRYLGTLARQAMPRAFGPEGRVAYVTVDDLDVQRVVVKQLLR